MPRVSRRGRATRAAKPPPPPTDTRVAAAQFAPESEVEFARILGFYALRWIYRRPRLPPRRRLPAFARVPTPPSQLERRVGKLGGEFARDYTGEAPMLVGVLKGVLC